MPPKKHSNATKEKSASANEARGSGSHSRIVLDFEKLRQAGWKVIEDKRKLKSSSTGLKVFYRYTNPAGKSVKSSKEVERQLKAEGNFDTFVCESERNYDERIERDPKAKTSNALSSDDDTDYEPPEKRSVQASKDEW